ncbi:MAG: sugar ABC transporter permease [Armatimonadota bacterium]|nr:sugar ABC transporter permease [Armatimonadota bacterium]MDR7558643.1 sugar ABC transporter permease [Armatimonadota bacterium]
MILPLVALLVGLSAYPFVYMLYMSAHTYNLAQWTPPRYVGTANFVQMARDSTMRASLVFTGLMAGIALPVELLLGLGLALLLRGVVGERVWRSLLLLPMMIPAVVAGIAWKMLYNFEFGPVNYALSKFGLERISWLGDFTAARIGLIIIDIWQWTPFVFLVLYAGLQNVPRDLVESATVDGAGGWAVTRFIELPFLAPLIWVVLIVRLIDILKLFDIVYMTTFGGPGSATHPLSFYIYKVGVSFGWDVGYGSALSMLLLAVITLLTNVLIRILHIDRLLELERA